MFWVVLEGTVLGEPMGRRRERPWASFKYWNALIRVREVAQGPLDCENCGVGGTALALR